jgi:hypothetical protein
MKILRYHHNKLDHRGVFFHGQMLSLQTDLSVTAVLSLPIAERNYLEGQSGKYLKAPMGMYPLSSPISSEELASLGDLAAGVSGENLVGSGARIPVSAAASATAHIAAVHAENGSIAGHAILVNVLDSGNVIASILGPWITTVDELGVDADLNLSVSVNGSASELNSLSPGDKVLVEVPALGAVTFELTQS